MLNQVVFPVLKSFYRQVRYRYWLHRSKKIGTLVLPEKEKLSILLLLPESGIEIYVHAFVVIAKQLKQLGYKVYFARCFNVFERCVFMDSESLPIQATVAEKKMLCTYCFRAFDKQVIKNGFEFVDLRHFTDPHDKKWIEEKIQQHPQKPFECFVGKLNLTGILEYNFFLYLKKANLANLTETELNLWQQYLKSLYVGYQAIKKLITQMKISHVMMCDAYSLNSLIMDSAKELKICFANLTFPFHKDVDTTKIKVLKNDTLTESFSALQQWPQFRNLCLSENQIKEIVDDLIVRMSKKGIYSYSPTKTARPAILDDLALSKDRKTIVAYPSSPDEVDSLLNACRQRGIALSIPEDAFHDQFEWLDELIEHVEQSEDLQLIIRLHPRMAPNDREKWGCPGEINFLKKYSKMYQYVKIIWPKDPISSFDLAEVADVVTISWSSLGMFMARLGIPVVSGLKMSLAVPNEAFHIVCQTREKYFENINKLAHQPLDVDRLKQAFRCYYLIYLGHTIDLSDVMGEKNAPAPETLSENAAFLENCLIKNKNIIEIHQQALAQKQCTESNGVENKELLKQLHRLIHFLMTNVDDFEKQKLNGFNIEGNNIQYYYQNDIYEKYSPLVKRLANLAMMAEGKNKE